MVISIHYAFALKTNNNFIIIYKYIFGAFTGLSYDPSANE